jgi:ABC-type molybdate transport system substrate-binding protein
VGIMTWTKSPEAAAALIRYLTANEGRAMFLSKGFTAPR